MLHFSATFPLGLGKRQLLSFQKSLSFIFQNRKEKTASAIGEGNCIYYKRTEDSNIVKQGRCFGKASSGAVLGLSS